MSRPAWAAFIGASLLSTGFSAECQRDCVKVPQTATFCGSLMAPFNVCPWRDGVLTQDHVAESRFKSTRDFNISSQTNCATTLRRFECMRSMPVCEFGRDYALLCRDACEDVIASCASELPGLTLAALNCTGSVLDLDTSLHCYDLDYTGPNKWLWVIGFVINFVFSFLAALGINLQKHSLRLHELDSPPTPSFRQKFWVLGFFLILSGSILDFIAFGLAPQSFLAPLAALSLVWNMLLAPKFHGERITQQNLVATTIICIGVTSSVIFSSHGTPTYLLSDLLLLYQKTAMYGYIICVCLALGIMYYTARKIEREKLDAGLLHIVCYGGLGGTFGGQSVTLAKSTIELIKSSFSGGDAFSHFASYLIVFAMAFCLVAQITFLNEGLRRFDALLVVPVYQAFWIIVSILGGLVYFEEYKTLEGLQMFMFVLGSLITVGGIGYLLHQRSDPATLHAATASISSPAIESPPDSMPPDSVTRRKSRPNALRKNGLTYESLSPDSEIELPTMTVSGADEKGGGLTPIAEGNEDESARLIHNGRPPHNGKMPARRRSSLTHKPEELSFPTMAAAVFGNDVAGASAAPSSTSSGPPSRESSVCHPRYRDVEDKPKDLDLGDGEFALGDGDDYLLDTVSGGVGIGAASFAAVGLSNRTARKSPIVLPHLVSPGGGSVGSSTSAEERRQTIFKPGSSSSRA